MNNQPTVSISCITYNHEPYIRYAIEGFLMQKTSFPFEILIHDDASTDKTPDIIREYEVKYPEIIKPIYQKENQYSKGIRISATYQFPRARGKYIALCEGDDYWTDPCKLQRQVEFLERYSNYVISYHDSQIINQGGAVIKKSKLHPKFKRDASEVELKKGFKVITQTMCFRSLIREWPEESKIAFGGG